VQADDREWLASLVKKAFVLRVLIAMVLHGTGLSERLAPDERTYSDTGFWIALYWSGEQLLQPWRLTSDQPLAYFYLNGVSNFVFGSSLPLKLLNALIGALSCRYAFLMADALFGSKVARTTASLTAFFPSLVLWSAVNIRDAWVVFLIVLLCWKSYQLANAFSILGLATVVGTILLINGFRQYLVLVVAIPPLVAVLIGGRGRLLRNFVLALLGGAAIVFLIQQGAASRAVEMMDLETIAQHRRDLAYGAGSAFEEGVDISTPGKALRFLPVGLAYFWFSPFPWQMTSFLKLISLPEMLLVYYLTPAIVRGIRYTLRARLREGLQVILLTALLTVSYALGSGNVGTLYRHRAQALVFYLMFGAVGLAARKGEIAARGATTVAV
jgi:4-amino-4-deoxy-L-arabinose transferase-like glycosyltransferase